MDGKNSNQTSRHKRQRRRHRAANARAKGGGSNACGGGVGVGTDTGTKTSTTMDIHSITKTLVHAMRNECAPVLHEHKDILQNFTAQKPSQANVKDITKASKRQRKKKAKGNTQGNTAVPAEQQSGHNKPVNKLTRKPSTTSFCCYCCPRNGNKENQQPVVKNKTVANSRAQTVYSTLSNRKISNLLNLEIRLVQSDTVVLYNSKMDHNSKTLSEPAMAQKHTPMVTARDVCQAQCLTWDTDPFYGSDSMDLDDISMSYYQASDFTTGNSECLEQGAEVCADQSIPYNDNTFCNSATNVSSKTNNATRCNVKHTYSFFNISEMFHECRLRALLNEARRIAYDLLHSMSRFSSDTQLQMHERSLSQKTVRSLREIVQILQILQFNHRQALLKLEMQEQRAHKQVQCDYVCYDSQGSFQHDMSTQPSGWSCKCHERKESPAPRSPIRNGKRLSRLEEYLLFKNNELDNKYDIYRKPDSSTSPASQTKTVYADADDFMDDDYMYIPPKHKPRSLLRRIFNNSFGLFCAAYISLIFTYETLDVTAYVAILSILLLLLVLLYFGVI